MHIQSGTLKLEQLKACIEDYLRQRGLPLRKAFRCLSPAHEDKHPSMSYNPRGSNVHCFACGVTYDLLDLIGLDYGLDDFSEKYEKACLLFGFENPHLEYHKNEKKSQISDFPEKIKDDRSDELDLLRNQADNNIGYFESRGVTAESCKKYGLFQHEGRAYFPVMEKGCCAGWCARAVNDELQPRYKNSKGALGLFNGDHLSENGGGKRLFITEGIIDAICLEQMGEQAVALCGSQNTAKLLRRCEVNLQAANSWRFVLCGDLDTAGQKMNEALSDGLQKLGLSAVVLEMQSADGDINSLYQSNRERLARLVYEAAKPTASTEYAATSAAAGIDAFFSEAQRRSERGAIPTGFAALDKLLDGGLHAGLYVLGAISSLGKTSFALQMADYIAENSADVLFFSLEQSRFELMAKSLSRTSAQLDDQRKKMAFTSRQLLSGNLSGGARRQQLLQDTRDVYAKASSGLFIREGIADIGAEDIRKAVTAHQEQRGRVPVVMLDYLQILKPTDPRATDKQNTDRAVVELKRLSRDFDIPVIAISSFNRENYRAAVSMEAFKESGAVEYSSDVLFGMQLAGVGEKGFDANAEKAKDPRKIELVMLKNRNGIPYAKVGMNYLAKFSLFEELGKTI